MVDNRDLAKNPQRCVERAKAKQKRRTGTSNTVKWWFGTVFLTLFPTLLTLFVGLLRGVPITLELLIGNGELVLSSFTIVTATLISCYNDGKRNSPWEEALFYFLLLVCPFELVGYAIVKTNEANKISVVGITSVLCLLTSIFTSWIWNWLMIRRASNSDPE